MSVAGFLRRWVRRRLAAHRKTPRDVPASVWPRAVQPPLPSFGLDVEQLRDRYAEISIDGGERGGLAGYARHDMERFLRTVDLVPPEARQGLEIGANPYFTTLLLDGLRPDLALTLTNFFGRAGGIAEQTVSLDDGEERTLTFHNVNIESDPLPSAPGSFDVVLYCEVLEHMTNDPVATLLNLRDALKPSGTLVLTTPNAARLESVARLIAGLNVYDQYSGFGPYGRHNREYTVHEVRALMTHCGFVEEVAYTADVHANHAAVHLQDPHWLAPLCGARADLLGQYIFSRWRRGDGEPQAGRPEWLYRSLPPAELSDAIRLIEPPGARH